MSTIQENLDIQNQRLLMAEQKELRDLFDNYLLGWHKENSRTTFSEIIGYAGPVSLNYKGLTSIKGISLMSNITSLSLEYNRLTVLEDLSGLTELTALYLKNNEITSISSVGGMSGLTNLELQNNNLSTEEVDSKLVELQFLHTTYGNISVIKLTGNSIPTDGLLNPYFVALDAAGVTVLIDS